MKRLKYWLFNMRDGVFWPFFGMICFTLGSFATFILLEVIP